MIYIITGLSLLYFLIGFILTEGNAKYLLSGYNTMSPAERKLFNLKDFIPFFKKFHFFLGISNLLLCLAFYYWISEEWSASILAIYPLIGYTYFFIKSRRFSPKSNKTTTYIILGTLIFTMGLIAYLFWDSYRENLIIISKNQIEITGGYGEKISISDIDKIELIDHIPTIKLRVNGYALEEIRKGYFKTKDREVVKLLLNSTQKSVILITKTNGKKVYYSSRTRSNKEEFERIKHLRK